MFARKSNRLTVGFNLRTGNALHNIQSPAGTAQTLSQFFVKRDGVVSSLRDLGVGLFRLFRRLKPTVNKVLSLRDSSDLPPFGGFFRNLNNL